MEHSWVLGIAILLFLVFLFLFWKVTASDAKKEYGSKMWNQWTTRLYYWQAAILYSVGGTVITMYLLKWVNILAF